MNEGRCGIWISTGSRTSIGVCGVVQDARCRPLLCMHFRNLALQVAWRFCSYRLFRKSYRQFRNLILVMRLRDAALKSANCGMSNITEIAWCVVQFFRKIA